MSSLVQKKQSSGYLLSFALCAAAGFFIFLPFAVADGGLFRYCGDFNSQQIPFYHYVNQFVKDGTGQFSWATDLGTSIVNGYAFYVLGSPFFWLSTLFPSAWVPFMMVPLFALKFGVAGLGAFGYLRRYTKTRNFAILGACLYALSGFTVYNTFFNHFVDCIALFPFLLWALDCAMLDDVHGIFPLTVGLNLINNYFFFAGQIVFLIIYFFWKCVMREYRLTGRKFFTLAFESLLGCGMGCLLLWPAVLCLADNPRTVDLSSGFGFLMYYYVQQYFAIFTSLFLPPDPTYLPSIYTEGVIKHTSLTAWLPIVGCVGALGYLRARKQTANSKIMLTCLFMAFVPVLNSLFYALNSSYYARWYYMPILIMCAASVHALESPDINLLPSWRSVTVITLAFLVFAIVPKQTDGVWSFGVANNLPLMMASICIAVLSLGIFYFIYTTLQSKERLARMMIAAVLGFSVFYGVVHVAEGKFPQWSGDFDYKMETYDGARGIDWPDGFYRIDAFECYDNVGLWTGKSSLQFFNSVVTPSIMEFYPTVDVKRDVSSKPEFDKYALRGLLGVHYTMTPNDRAQEFDEQYASYGWSECSSDDVYTLFVNENALPMGFAYDNYITLDELSQVAKVNTANVLMRAIGITEEQLADYPTLSLAPLTHDAYGEALTYENYQMDVADRRLQSVQNFVADGSGFTCNITLNADNLVFFSVPYDAGFTAVVNGVERPVEKVSNGMCAVFGTKGTNEIVFTYATPGLKESTIVTVLSLAIWGVYLVLIWRKKKKNQ